MEFSSDAIFLLELDLEYCWHLNFYEVKLHIFQGTYKGQKFKTKKPQNFFALD